LSILLLGAFLRFVRLGQSPPGLNQDEAVNAWNAYCLLKTGKDQHGVSWPIFYARGLGGNRSTLYIYLMLPFQAIGGLNICTTRLPAAVGGVFTILLIYFVGRKLFDQKVGLVAAGFLAFNPWHLQQSRWGHEASLGALLGIVPLALLLGANIFFGNDKTRTPKPVPAALAGAITGICCYGYQAVRLFVPVFLLTVGLVTLPSWLHHFKTRKGTLAVTAFFVTFAFVFGPLVFKHLTDPDGIGKRAQTTYLWQESDTVTQKVQKVVTRYAGHFGPDFLFIQGDQYPIQSLPDVGQFHWYMLPLMILGLIVLVGRFRSISAVRILFAYVLVYPVGDCFSKHISLHALRSSPGLCGLILLAAVGAVSAGRWLQKQNRILTLSIAAVSAVVLIGLNARYLRRFYGEYNRRLLVYHGYHADLIEACNWLRPRFDALDAVFCTSNGMNMPYVITLVGLRYEPDRWFHDGHDVFASGAWDVYARYGKVHFMYSSPSEMFLKQLHEGDLQRRVVFLVRPGELDLRNPVHEICRPDGVPTLWICQP
jgi:4-amino-4-deoxy-L-arabinose transferase-like glycosyltransferase